MSKFLHAVRKWFSKNKDVNSVAESEDEKKEAPQNDFQKGKRVPREYDEVTLPEDGSGPHLDPGAPNDVQAPRPRAPRPYDEVDLKETQGGVVEIKDS